VAEGEPSRRWKSRWRPCFFLAALIAATWLGFLFHTWAREPTPASPTDNRSQLSVWFFSAQRGEHVSMTLVIRPKTEGSVAALYVRDLSGEPFVLLASENDIDLNNPDHNAFHKFHRLPESNGGGKLYNFFYYSRGLDPAKQTAGGDLIAYFAIPPSSVNDVGTSMQFNLPTLAPSETGDDFYPFIGAVGKGTSARPPRIFLNLTPRVRGNLGHSPADYKSAHSSASLSEVFWEPALLSATETVRDVGGKLDQSSVLVANPSEYVLESGNVTWHGSFDLQPFMVTETRTAADTRDRWDFLSGVAFATAAAALIAFFQETPDDVKTWFRRRRRRPASGAAQGTEATAEPEPTDTEAPAGG
jgi:hypothetical protein